MKPRHSILHDLAHFLYHGTPPVLVSILIFGLALGVCKAIATYLRPLLEML